MEVLLQIDNIEEGLLEQTVNAEIALICQSVINDPYNTTAREVTMKLKLKPDVKSIDGQQFNQPAIDWSVTHKMPGHKGMTTRAFVKGDKVIINTGQPYGGNINQTTIFDKGE